MSNLYIDYVKRLYKVLEKIRAKCFKVNIFISEFDFKAVYRNTKEPKYAASSWSEEYQEQIYKD